MTEQQKARLEYAKTAKEEWPENLIDPTAIIHPTAQIGMDGFGFAREVDGTYIKMPHAGNIEIHKFVEIRAFVTVDRAVNGSTIIGEGTKIDHHVHIAHNAKIGKYNTFANGCSIEGSCEIGSFNTFGSNVTVQRKVKIGNGCRFGSGAVVVKDVPDGSKVVGNPGRIL
jgi:UDP-3-O-[3-hydroxymyristoyl] glucosamine N-acyltransferase